MKFRFTLIALAIGLLSNSAIAQVDWAIDIAPIMYKNCSACHNSHGIAPFEIMSYNDAVQNASDIVDAVNNKVMPPWPPDPSYNHLAHERILSQQEINDINDWVNNGTPRGDSTLEPAAPVITTSAQITHPDMVISAPVYTVNTGSNDLYRNFVVPTGITATKYLTAIEAIPGNRNIVHHVLIYADTTGVPASLDAADPGPGYTNISGTGSTASKLIGAWVPGQTAYYTPNGMGIRLGPNTSIIMQIHYPEGLSNEIDSTKINFLLTSTPQREIDIETPLNHYQLDQGFLIIPANQVKTYTAHYTVPVDISALSVGPHMHLIGSAISSWGITPSHDTLPFIDIPNWDFHWQGYYAFRYVVKIPAGTTIYSSATYNNTASNPHNPNNPPHLVTLGESTTDEMMLIYFSYTTYHAGDENILIDSSLVSTGINTPGALVNTLQLYDPAPNPAQNSITIQYFVPSSGDVKMRITDLQGKIIREKNHSNVSGLASEKISIENLPAGIYFLNVENNGVLRTKRFVKE
jgi:hypothetical protein